MSLDTVELVWNIEKHFGLRLPDAECARIGTVGEMAQWLGAQLGTLAERNSAARATIMRQLQQLFEPRLAAEDTLLRVLLPDKEASIACGQQLTATTGLLWPDLTFEVVVPPRCWLGNWFPAFVPKPLLPTDTFGNLVNWTVAHNYQKLLTPPFDNQFDVEQAVIGLTSFQSGVSEQEITLASSFTNDLGMD